MTKESTIPGVTWNDDGSATINLKKPLTVEGKACSSLRMRCPSLADVEVMEKHEGSELDKEKETIAAWCGVTVAELAHAAWPDYRRIQRVFAAYVGGEPENFTLPPAA